MLPFSVKIQDGVPVSDQIVQAARKALLAGQLANGDVFPSVRALSQELRISPTTAHKVVTALKDEGFLASRPGIGMVVTTSNLPTIEERLAHLKPLCRKLLQEAQELGLESADVLAAVQQAFDAQAAAAASEQEEPSELALQTKDL